MGGKPSCKCRLLIFSLKEIWLSFRVCDENVRLFSVFAFLASWKTAKIVMEKSWNFIIRFLWEPCTKSAGSVLLCQQHALDGCVVFRIEPTCSCLCVPSRHTLLTSLEMRPLVISRYEFTSSLSMQSCMRICLCKWSYHSVCMPKTSFQALTLAMCPLSRMPFWGCRASSGHHNLFSTGPWGQWFFLLVLRMPPLFLLGIGKTRKATLIRTYFLL